MNEFMNLSVSFYQNIEVSPCDLCLRSTLKEEELLLCEEEGAADMLRLQIEILRCACCSIWDCCTGRCQSSAQSGVKSWEYVVNSECGSSL
jgi:hypothetical protein